MANIKSINAFYNEKIVASWMDNGYYSNKGENVIDDGLFNKQHMLLDYNDLATDIAAGYGGIIYGSIVYKSAVAMKTFPNIPRSSGCPKDMNIIFKKPSDQQKFIDEFSKQITVCIADQNKNLAKLEDKGYKMRLSMLPTNQTEYTNDIIWAKDPESVKYDRIVIDIFNPNKIYSQFTILTINTKSAKTYGTLTSQEFANFVLDKITLKKYTKIVADPFGTLVPYGGLIYYDETDFQ